MVGTDRFLTLNGLKLHYVDHGRAGDPAVLLLHGVTFDGHMWDRFASQVGVRCRVLSLTARGHGDSARAESYEGSVFVEDAAAFIDAAGISPALMCGYSMGGSVGMGLAAIHPDKVSKLIIVESSPDATTSEGRRRIAEAMHSGPDSFDTIEEAVESQRGGIPFVDDDMLRDFVKHAFARCEDGKLRGKTDPRMLQAMGWTNPDAGSVGGADLEGLLWGACALIKCPTLIVRGTESDVVSRQSAERMVAAISDAKLVEAEGGHALPFQNPLGLYEAVRGFL